MNNLRGRIEKLEMLLSRICEQIEAESCICGKVIHYHTSDELELILAERCAVHGVVEPRCTWQHPPDMPVAPEHRKYCKCPPNLWREFQKGARPRPTMDELMDEHNARTAAGGDGEREFKEEHARIERIIAGHKEVLRVARENQ